MAVGALMSVVLKSQTLMGRLVWASPCLREDRLVRLGIAAVYRRGIVVCFCLGCLDCPGYLFAHDDRHDHDVLHLCNMHHEACNRRI